MFRRLLLALVLATTVTACAIVPKNRRRYLADPTMQPNQDVLRDRAHAKIHAAREGAAGRRRRAGRRRVWLRELAGGRGSRSRSPSRRARAGARGVGRAERRDDHRRRPGLAIEDLELARPISTSAATVTRRRARRRGEPGSERMWILEPWALITVRQNARVVAPDHDPGRRDHRRVARCGGRDDLGVARNKIESTSTCGPRSRSERDTLTTRAAAHHEEPLSSGTLGAGWTRSFADNNATLGASANDHDRRLRPPRSLR